MKFKITLTLLIFIAFQINTYAQEKINRFNIQLAGGATYGVMDIQPEIGYIGNIGLNFHLSPILYVQGNVGYGFLSGSESTNGGSMQFENQFYYSSFQGFFNLSKLTQTDRYAPNLGLLAGFGAGLMQNDAINPGQDFQHFREYDDINVIIPLTAGIKYNLSDRLDLDLMASYFLTTTDELDGYNPPVIQNRGNDGFATATLGLTFKLGNTSNQHAFWEKEEGRGEIQELKAQVDKNTKGIKKINEGLQDSDGDGVIDLIDEDNTTPEGVRVTTKGVPMDTDYDGVPDYLDDCPLTPGSIENDGCPTGKTAVKVESESGEEEMEFDDETSDRGSTPRKKRADKSDEMRSWSPDKDEDTEDTGGEERRTKLRNPAGDREKYGDYPKREYTAEQLEAIPVTTFNESSRDKYYIVGGSFRNKGNVADLISFLKEEGYDADIIQNESTGLYHAAYGSFDDEFEARSKMEEVRQRHNPEAYLLYQK